MLPSVCDADSCSVSVMPKGFFIFIMGGVYDIVDLMHDRLTQFVVVLCFFLCCLWITSLCCRVSEGAVLL